MPKYISITPSFTPYSVDELMRVPLQMASEAKEQERVYNEQMDKLATIEAMAGDNQEVKDFMAPYYTARDQAVEAMSSGNYNPEIVNINNNLRNLWRDKGLKTEAGLNAYTAYQKARPQDAIGGNYSIIDFINNPTLQADYVSGDRIEKDTADIVTKLAASLPPRQREKFLDNSQYLISQGYSLEEIMGAMGGDDSLLGQSVADIRNQYGYDTMSNPEDRAAVDRRIFAGAAAGLQRYSTASNPNYMTSAQRLAYNRAVNESNSNTNTSSTSGKGKESQWIHEPGTPIGTVGEVQTKWNANGSKVQRIKNDSGSWDDYGYTPAPAKTKVNPSDPSFVNPLDNTKATVTKIKDGKVLRNSASTVTDANTRKKIQNMINSGELIETSLDEFNKANRDAIIEGAPDSVDHPERLIIYRHREGKRNEFYVVSNNYAEETTQQTTGEAEVSAENKYKGAILQDCVIEE